MKNHRLVEALEKAGISCEQLAKIADDSTSLQRLVAYIKAGCPSAMRPPEGFMVIRTCDLPRSGIHGDLILG